MSMKIMKHDKAMHYTLKWGDAFVKEFDAIYQNPKEEDVPQRVEKMQWLVDAMLDIRLAPDNEPLCLRQKLDWFFTCGSTVAALFGNSAEAKAYDKMIDNLVFDNDVEEALYLAKIIFDASVSQLFPIKDISSSECVLPPIDLLSRTSVSKDSDSEEVHRSTELLLKTFADFGVEVSLADVARGARVIRFEVAPALGGRVDAITSLYSEIMTAFHTDAVRMEIPKPGDATVFFEIPEKKPHFVRLRDLIETSEFRKLSLPACIGEGENNTPILYDLRSAEHLLIAGATGTGKSMCLCSVLTGLLYKTKPKDLRLILIDPKGTEFTSFRQIPHLLTPVITDPLKVVPIFEQVNQEMHRRYELMRAFSVKDISAYNEKTRGRYETLPDIVIAIDEFYDCSCVSDHLLKDLVLHIAFNGRAAGIHLLIATQCPDECISEGIRRNIATHIAFTMFSSEGSRAFLGADGAEKLMGKGDMLISARKRPKLIRAQGAFVSEEEVAAVINYLER